jgi:glycosyltransferase involved in cell wall biosynthesis
VALADRLPFPLDSGYSVRVFHLIREIASRIDTTLVVFHPDDSNGVLDEFRSAVGGRLSVVTVPPPRRYSPLRLALGVLSRRPIQAWNTRSRAFEKALKRVVREDGCDIGVAFCTFMFPYLERVSSELYTVVDTQNIDSVVMQRYVPRLHGPHRRAYARLTARKLEGFERKIFRRANQVWVCSKEERSQLRRRDLLSDVRVIPNGVNVQSFAREPRTSPAKGRLLFFGNLDYFPNVDAVQYLLSEIFPQVRSAHPDAELHIVGRGGAALAQLGAGREGVRFVGAVPDIYAAIAEAEVVVVPLRVGGGTRLKILETLAVGRPVVSTSIGAEGLAVTAGKDLLIEDDPAAFASAVVQMLEDGGLGERIGINGQRRVREAFDWAVIGDEIADQLGPVLWEQRQTAAHR